MKSYLILGIISILIIPASLFAARLNVDDSNSRLFMFYTDEDKIGVKAVLRGTVLEFGVKEELDKNERDLGKSVQDRTKVSVRLVSTEGVIPGSVLYVVNERNLVVAKIRIVKIFDSPSFYKMCVGYGNFRAVKKDYRVVQKSGDAEAGNSYVYVSKGRYFSDTGDVSKAIEFYQKAIAIDKDNPEAHSSLGYLYLEQKLLPFAIKEFDIAYMNIGKLYDREEKYLLLKGSAQARYMAVFFSELPKGHKIREKYIDEGMEFCRKAASLYPDSVEAHYYLGRFHYDRSIDEMNKIDTDNDEKAVLEFEKVIAIKNDFTDAYIILARIFKKHNDKSNALMYISKAVSLDPKNRDAEDLYKAIKKMR